MAISVIKLKKVKAVLMHYQVSIRVHDVIVRIGNTRATVMQRLSDKLEETKGVISYELEGSSQIDVFENGDLTTTLMFFGDQLSSVIFKDVSDESVLSRQNEMKSWGVPVIEERKAMYLDVSAGGLTLALGKTKDGLCYKLVAARAGSPEQAFEIDTSESANYSKEYQRHVAIQKHLQEAKEVQSVEEQPSASSSPSPVESLPIVEEEKQEELSNAEKQRLVKVWEKTNIVNFELLYLFKDKQSKQVQEYLEKYQILLKEAIPYIEAGNINVHHKLDSKDQSRGCMTGPQYWVRESHFTECYEIERSRLKGPGGVWDPASEMTVILYTCIPKERDDIEYCRSYKASPYCMYHIQKLDVAIKDSKYYERYLRCSRLSDELQYLWERLRYSYEAVLKDFEENYVKSSLVSNVKSVNSF